MGIQAGPRASVEAVVTEDDTARALGSGEVWVLGTPRVVALAEAATVAALAHQLDPDTTTVGARVELDHLAPSRVGARVRAEAVLNRVDGRRLEFTVTVTEDGQPVARGVVTRVVVDRARFPAGPAQASTDERG